MESEEIKKKIINSSNVTIKFAWNAILTILFLSEIIKLNSKLIFKTLRINNLIYWRIRLTVFTSSNLSSSSK